MSLAAPQVLLMPGSASRPKNGGRWLGADDPEGVHVAWLNQGASTEDPWTLTQYEARDFVERTFEGRVTTSFIEKVALGPAAAGHVDRLVGAGTALVFATSAPLAPDVTAASLRHPSARFEQARGGDVAANLSTYTGAHEESAYLAGLAAGVVSQHGRVGYVAPVYELETLRILNGFALGVRSARPDAVVVAEWIDEWWNPQAERESAERLLEQGVDVLATGCTGPETAAVSQQVGVPWCGQDADRSAEFGDVWVTAPRILPGRYFCRRISDVMDGRWQSGRYVGGLADGFTDIAPLGRVVPPSARRWIMERRGQSR